MVLFLKTHCNICKTTVSPRLTFGSVSRGSYDASGWQVGYCSFIVMMSQEHLHTCRIQNVNIKLVGRLRIILILILTINTQCVLMNLSCTVLVYSSDIGLREQLNIHNLFSESQPWKRIVHVALTLLLLRCITGLYTVWKEDFLFMTEKRKLNCSACF